MVLKEFEQWNFKYVGLLDIRKNDVITGFKSIKKLREIEEEEEEDIHIKVEISMEEYLDEQGDEILYNFDLIYSVHSLYAKKWKIPKRFYSASFELKQEGKYTKQKCNIIILQ